MADLDAELAHPNTVQIGEYYITPKWLVSTESGVQAVPHTSITRFIELADGVTIQSSAAKSIRLTLSARQVGKLQSLVAKRAAEAEAD